MHAIVRCGQGQHYISTVFGYYCKTTATDDYKRYLEGIHNRYYLVLNREKNRLIKQYIFDKNSKYLDPTVLIIESDSSDWTVDDKGQGCVSFLSEVPQEYIEDDLKADVLDRCIQMDAEYHYNEYPEISCQKDIDDLMDVSGWFHDACIEKLAQQNDGSLYVLFDGVWGCKIEMWFSDEVAYNVDSRNPDKYDPYWSCSTMLIEAGFIYFVDDDGMEISGITDDYCWFKAKKLKYHITPN